MPPPTKRQMIDSGGSGAHHEDGTGFLESCRSAILGQLGGFFEERTRAAAREAKAAANKRPRKVSHSADGSLLKAEWCELSKAAQRRHVKNEILSRIRAIIPGPGKLSENSLMLQAAARIKELEIEIERANNYLEKLKLQGSEGTPDKNLKDNSVAAAVPVIQGTDGPEAIKAVLPQPTKAKGKRLLQYAWKYLSELGQELRQVEEQIAENKQPNTSSDKEAQHLI